MSPERTNAYRRVLNTVAELGPTKLQDDEQDQIRYAADSLIFCADLGEDKAIAEALIETQLMLDVLVESGRGRERRPTAWPGTYGGAARRPNRRARAA